MKFTDLNLSDPILRALEDQKYEKPTPIQAEVIPTILNNSDVMAAAQTGTGKTAGFVLPILSKLSNPKNNYKGHQLRALILTPTRELAAQVRESVNTYSKYLSIRSTAVYGGARIHNQQLKLRKGVDVLVATPGRLLDLYNQKSVNFKNIEIFVLDEADQMLDLGFFPAIKRVYKNLPEKKQSVFISATMLKPVRALANEFLVDPEEINLSPRATPIKKIRQKLIFVNREAKLEKLADVIEEEKIYQAIIFTKTKIGADKLALALKKNKIKASK